MAHRMLNDPDADGWERSDFPIVCETCLGPNPYVRMQRIEFGGTCHISGRPYTVFRWRPGNDARYKKTIICQEVAKAKNVCQVCLFDLDYGLPVQVRDTALGIEKEEIPESDVGKEFQLQEQISKGQTESSFGGGAGGGAASDMLLRLQRTAPYYKRNQARICSFFVKGTCNRGAECPYRHEMPVQNELSEQNIKDRYYGINDPVANKMMRRVSEQPTLELPEDRSITSLYVGGVTPEITEEDLKDAFYTYGEIAGVRKVGSRFCAFVTFAERSAAEAAAEGLANKLIIKGVRLRLMWGRPQQGRQQQQLEHDPMQPIPSGGSAGGAAAAAAAAAGGGGGGGGGADYFGLQQQQPAAAAAMSYPSMDPTAMGARIPAKRAGDAGADDDASKRQRGGAAAAAGTGYGAPPPGYGLMPQGPPPPHMAAAMHSNMGMGMGPPPMQMPPMPQMPPQMQMQMGGPPGYGFPPPQMMGMPQMPMQMRPPPPHMMGPPMGMLPPGGVRPPSAAAVPPPRPPAPAAQQQQQAGSQHQQQQQQMPATG
uniref:Uncharacterized protein n=1 Tax=Tetradesmus obliquus TaxID=3088 RepID=A0A383VKM8_TETOB|eukprot:jgi/Sobl393_1/10310/SZX64926.1